MSYEKNVRDYPEDYGLTIVAEMDAGASYSFDIHIVFKHTDGTLYYGQDSGCSCPHPFEDFTCLEDLRKIDKEGFNDFEKMIRALDSGDFTITEKAEFLYKVEMALGR